MIRKIIFMLLVLFALQNANSQTTIVSSPELNPKPLFFGGGLVLGGGAGTFQIGLNPELVKRYNDYVDLGAAVNFYYASYKYLDNSGNLMSRTNNTQLGVGGFARVWPLQKLFIQIQPEYNYTWSRLKDRSTIDISSGVSRSFRFGAESLLAGIGYGSRSENGMTYFSVMIDLLQNPNSPYRDGYNRAEPIIRAGFAFPILRSKPE